MQQSSDTAAAESGAIPPAPVFYPSEEDWVDPLAYVRRIQRGASRFGICKVIPPASWKPPKAARPAVKFGTRQQNIHQLFQRRGVYERFMTFLRQFHRAHGDWVTCRAQVPRIKGRIVDLLRLYRSVIAHGGYDQVNRSGLWRYVATYELRMIWTTSISANTKSVYHRWLLPLERYERRRRGSASLKSDPLGLEFTHFACRNECACCLLERLCENNHLPPEGSRSMIGNDLSAAAAAYGISHPSSIVAENPESATKSMGSRLWQCIHCADAWHPACYARTNHDESGATLETVTDGAAFVCPQCDDDRRFGYLDGTVFSYREYARFAQEFKRAWFRVGISSRTDQVAAKEPSIEEIEREYWRLVDTAEERCEVLYGSELDVNVSGSGFPRLGATRTETLSGEDRAVWERYAVHPWNLNIFPLLGSSLLRVLSARYSGITDPWLYIGMCFATFCYHSEDSDMYSINYMHSGEGKIWYGCPGGDGSRQFESAMRASVPELFAAMPDLLYNMITMVNPKLLCQRGAPLCRTVQMPGEFVLTFPQAYHGGFSLGVNMAEAVNFALPEWLPYGRQAMVRYREMRREAPFAQEEIIFSALERRDIWQTMPLEELERLCQELRHLIREELALRDAASCFGRSPERMEDPRSPRYVSHAGSERDTCRWCRQPFFLSAVQCACDLGQRTCVRHAFALCACTNAAKKLLYLYSDTELQCMVDDPSQAVVIRERLDAATDPVLARKQSVEYLQRVAVPKGCLYQTKMAQNASDGMPTATVDCLPSETALPRGGRTARATKRELSGPALVGRQKHDAAGSVMRTTPITKTVTAESSTSVSHDPSRISAGMDPAAMTTCWEPPRLVTMAPSTDGQAPFVLLFRVPSE